MKKAYISRFISNFIRAIALVLCAIMCMGCFIACSEGSNKNEDGRDKDISSNVDSVHDSWESVLDAFLNAVEKGDTDTLLSLIAPAVSDTMRTPPNSVVHEDILEYCTEYDKSEFNSWNLASLKIYGKRIILTENVYEEAGSAEYYGDPSDYEYFTGHANNLDKYYFEELKESATANIEDAVIVIVEIDLEYYGIRLAYNDINGDNPIDEFIFIKQGGEWYLGYGGGELFHVIYDIFWDHAG